MVNPSVSSQFTRRLSTLALAAIVIGCGDPAEPLIATSMTAQDGNPTTGIVGSAIFPAVVVLDQNSNPLAGVEVTFAVTGGGGSLIGAATTTTSPAGVAAVSGWKLGNTVGLNTLSATGVGVSAVSLQVNSTASTPATISKIKGDNSLGAAGAAVALVPTARVLDEFGNGVPNAAVTFAVASGGGSIAGGAATTNANGDAAVSSWTLGALGTNTVTASTTGAATATFTATAIQSIAMGATANGSITATDCRPQAGSSCLDDTFAFTLAAQTSIAITVSSAEMHPYAGIVNASGVIIAESVDIEENAPTSTIRAVLPAGTYGILATTAGANEVGAYSVSLATASESLSECGFMWTTRGVTLTQTLAATDCKVQDGGGNQYNADIFVMYLPSGSVLTADMTSTAFDTWIDLLTLQGVGVAFNDDISASNTNSKLVVNIQTTSYYVLIPNSAQPQTTGAYQLVIAPPAVAAANPVSLAPASGRRLGRAVLSRGSALGRGAMLLNGGSIRRR